jgi:hypothetical protein
LHRLRHRVCNRPPWRNCLQRGGLTKYRTTANPCE